MLGLSAIDRRLSPSERALAAKRRDMARKEEKEVRAYSAAPYGSSRGTRVVEASSATTTTVVKRTMETTTTKSKRKGCSSSRSSSSSRSVVSSPSSSPPSSPGAAGRGMSSSSSKHNQISIAEFLSKTSPVTNQDSMDELTMSSISSFSSHRTLGSVVAAAPTATTTTAEGMTCSPSPCGRGAKEQSQVVVSTTTIAKPKTKKERSPSISENEVVLEGTGCRDEKVAAVVSGDPCKRVVAAGNSSSLPKGGQELVRVKKEKKSQPTRDRQQPPSDLEPSSVSSPKNEVKQRAHQTSRNADKNDNESDNLSVDELAELFANTLKGQIEKQFASSEEKECALKTAQASILSRLGGGGGGNDDESNDVTPTLEETIVAPSAEGKEDAEAGSSSQSAAEELSPSTTTAHSVQEEEENSPSAQMSDDDDNKKAISQLSVVASPAPPAIDTTIPASPAAARVNVTPHSYRSPRRHNSSSRFRRSSSVSSINSGGGGGFDDGASVSTFETALSREAMMLDQAKEMSRLMAQVSENGLFSSSSTEEEVSGGHHTASDGGSSSEVAEDSGDSSSFPGTGPLFEDDTMSLATFESALSRDGGLSRMSLLTGSIAQLSDRNLSSPTSEDDDDECVDRETEDVALSQSLAVRHAEELARRMAEQIDCLGTSGESGEDELGSNDDDDEEGEERDGRTPEKKKKKDVAGQWQTFWSEEHQKEYYYNPVTNDVSWTQPEGVTDSEGEDDDDDVAVMDFTGAAMKPSSTFDAMFVGGGDVSPSSAARLKAAARKKLGLKQRIRRCGRKLKKRAPSCDFKSFMVSVVLVGTTATFVNFMKHPNSGPVVVVPGAILPDSGAVCRPTFADVVTERETIRMADKFEQLERDAATAKAAAEEAAAASVPKTTTCTKKTRRLRHVKRRARKPAEADDQQPAPVVDETTCSAFEEQVVRESESRRKEEEESVRRAVQEEEEATRRRAQNQETGLATLGSSEIAGAGPRARHRPNGCYVPFSHVISKKCRQLAKEKPVIDLDDVLFWGMQ